MSNWITDRLPTEPDDAFEDWVFVMNHGNVQMYLAVSVTLGMPWQPIVPPDPYVKPKRWAVCKDSNGWNLNDGDTTRYFLPTDCSDAAAQRIADVYNEVMP
jgi:hypothetical protein